VAEATEPPLLTFGDVCAAAEEEAVVAATARPRRAGATATAIPATAAGPDVDGVPYALFGLIVVALALAWFWLRHRSEVG
jgi:hypothetical protein